MLPMMRMRKSCLAFDFWCKRFVLRVCVWYSDTLNVRPTITHWTSCKCNTDWMCSWSVLMEIQMHIERVYSVCLSGYHFHVRVRLVKMIRSFFTLKSKDSYNIRNKILHKLHAAWFRTIEIYLFLHGNNTHFTSNYGYILW